MPKNPERPWEDDPVFNALDDLGKLAVLRSYAFTPNLVMQIPQFMVAWLLHKAEKYITKQGPKA